MSIDNDFDFHSLEKSSPGLEVMREQILNPELFKLPESLTDKDHSAKLDNLLGYKIRQVEQSLLSQCQAFYKTETCKKGKKKYQGTQAWIGLHPQTLQTPYSEILDFFTLLQKESINSIIDFGAAYGRVGIVANALFRGVDFLGYEIIGERIAEGERVLKSLELDNCSLEEKNILDPDFELPEADVYFIYDFSNPEDLKKILAKISKKMYTDRFFLVARGKGIRSLIQLRYPEYWASHGVIHQGEWSLYSSFRDLV